MDRKNLIGIILIMILFLVWAQINNSTAKKLKEKEQSEQTRTQTEITEDNYNEDTTINKESTSSELPINTESIRENLQSDEYQEELNKRLVSQYGVFSKSATGDEKTFTLENELISIQFSSKGAFIQKAVLVNYDQWAEDSLRNRSADLLQLLNDPKNKFYYILPILNTPEGTVRTQDLYFEGELIENKLMFTANTNDGGYFRQIYTLDPDSYNLQYEIQIKGLENSWKRDHESVELYWENWLKRLELNTGFEKNYSTIYYRPTDASPDYCSCRSDDLATAKNKPIKWFSHANQFFNSSLIANTSFANGEFSTRMLPDEAPNLKVTTARIQVPFSPTNPQFAMNLYVGPNEFDRLRSYHEYLEDIIPYGSSIFGSINRWIIRPLFNFLSNYIVSAGLVILALTLIVKLLLSPLTYKMLHSQSKMGALKPEMAQIKEKYKDDAQQIQVETMKLYREYGVNPLGGCMPMLLQMPIWFALYRFFPAAIDFRQKSFLWADDLSSYDVFMYLPFNIPFYGEHVSLFTLLWAGTTVAYTYYNSKVMDMSNINPAMKYMQYLMPIMFIFFFNSFAAGLATYLFFSNVLNIGQIIITKNYLINHDKIRAELEVNKKKPKKKTGFAARLEEAMKQQQQIKASQEKGKKK